MTTHQDHRLTQIHHWLAQVMPDADYKIKPASSDASFRRYFRVSDGQQSWIVMDAPPEHENLLPFISIGQFLHQHAIPVPQIYQQNITEGFLLLSDLGSSAFLNVVDTTNADQLYQAAIDELIQMQLSPARSIQLPHYNETLLTRELELFPEWFLKRHLNIDVPDFLPDLFQLLIDSAQQQPQLFVHRDYHSRNLMVLADNSLGIIDFQDAVIGPVSYDLVSLLRDCYIYWPADKLSQWLDYYFERAVNAGLINNTRPEQFRRWFDLMGLQRHIKVLGIFCRLNYRDGKTNYMNDLPLTMQYVREVSQRYPELKPLHDFVTTNPIITAQL